MTDCSLAPDGEKKAESRPKRRKGRPARPVIRDDGRRYESAGVAAIENDCSAPTIRSAIEKGTSVNGHTFAFCESEGKSDEERSDGEGDGRERLLHAGACQGDRDSAIDDRPLHERSEAERGLRADPLGGSGRGSGEALRECAMKCPMKFNNLRDGDADCDENCAWILKSHGSWFCSVQMLAAKMLDGVVFKPSFIDGDMQVDVEPPADDGRERRKDSPCDE